MEIPAEVIPMDTMILLISDLQILESHFQRTYGRADLYKDALDTSSYYVFEDFGTDKATFDHSLRFYSANADTLFRIYESTFDTLMFRSNSGLTPTNEEILQ